MKIIKKGKVPDKKKYICECNYCHTKVELKYNEFDRIFDRNEDTCHYYCPICKRTVFIRESKLDSYKVKNNEAD